MTDQNNSFFKKHIRLRVIFSLGATTFFLTSCNSVFRRNPRPELAERAYTLEEKTWSQLIKANYPNWTEPSLTYEPQYPKANSSSQLQTNRYKNQFHSKMSRSTYNVEPLTERKTLNSKSNDLSSGNNSSAAEETTSSVEDKLPSAIIDIGKSDDGYPYTLESFEIVPDDHLVDGTILETRHYDVKQGETLISIARQIYGDDSAWIKIYKSNLDVLRSPHHIKPGMTLIIP